MREQVQVRPTFANPLHRLQQCIPLRQYKFNNNHNLCTLSTSDRRETNENAGPAICFHANTARRKQHLLLELD